VDGGGELVDSGDYSLLVVFLPTELSFLNYWECLYYI